MPLSVTVRVDCGGYTNPMHACMHYIYVEEDTVIDIYIYIYIRGNMMNI